LWKTAIDKISDWFILILRDFFSSLVDLIFSFISIKKNKKMETEFLMGDEGTEDETEENKEETEEEEI